MFQSLHKLPDKRKGKNNRACTEIRNKYTHCIHRYCQEDNNAVTLKNKTSAEIWK